METLACIQPGVAPALVEPLRLTLEAAQSLPAFASAHGELHSILADLQVIHPRPAVPPAGPCFHASQLLDKQLLLMLCKLANVGLSIRAGGGRECQSRGCGQATPAEGAAQPSLRGVAGLRRGGLAGCSALPEAACCEGIQHDCLLTLPLLTCSNASSDF